MHKQKTDFLAKFLYAFLNFSKHATCSVHLILYFLILIFGKKYKLQSSTLNNFVHPAAAVLEN